MVVFDLDDCLWHPEMHELSGCPKKPVIGDLGNGQQGVIGAQTSGRDTVRLYDGALKALQQLHTDPQFKDVVVGAASSCLEPRYADACMDLLEVVPGVTIGSMFRYRQIGRTGKLTSSKVTHFRELHQESGIPFSEMLFFDDCNWGDHVQAVGDAYGVVGQRTPSGMTQKDWNAGLAKFAAKQSSAQSH
eukprot:CAMPEP_0174367542 /NCGR_PEP_ID=MMETSP0811_2-20130205/85714_1 /TAXON_ID=73025 ORGANISM="Eutreptiella gymnastica-like, Strain CCMP1594" /NCGR_SAMPLE_ID=MMETSP0811_2 /ASSEMBLY_ACC=CAM_ASM_000667 /LENGTH=188 /DNA_ID=CAMNT_0015510225 /DNA_START=35 /DNA_END=601 /DNA_ORIENTATION=+